MEETVMAGFWNRIYRTIYRQGTVGGSKKQRAKKKERTSAQVDKEDFLLKQIDEFREKAKQLQQLLASKETKVAELQNIVEEREEKAEKLESVLTERKEAAEVLLTGVQSQMNDMITEVEEKLNQLAGKIAADVNDSTGRTAEQTAEIQATLDEVTQKLDAMKLEIADKIHTEDVKCYRNMADLIAELTKKIEENDKLEQKMDTTHRLVKWALGFGIINFVLLLAGIGCAVCRMLGVL